MTAQGENILAFLDRAITERAETARSADKELGGAWAAKWVERTDSFSLATDSGIVVAADLPPGVAGHAALHDPASVLRRCAADRKLIYLHGPNGGDCLMCANPEEVSEDSDGNYEYYRSSLDFPCPTIVALAEGYGWTEGER
ncbi:DUF6221 family protein [Streptomyces sp. NPDC087866]|uniref:DUF6221 family protein n=1 Tax=Streptomyces sp. NPDC087866 TaxID=3365815 RepID=UPI0038202DE6